MDKVTQIMERWNALQPLSERDRELLSRRFTIDFNYNSNHIEGNTLTYGQTEILLLFVDFFMMLSKILIIQQRPCSWISVAFLHLLPKITSDSKGISRNTKSCWTCYLRLIYRLISNKSCFLQLIEPYYFVILHGKSIDMTNERYIEKREKIAEDYWKKASVKELNYIKR